MDLIYLMGGTGKRAGLGYPKQFYKMFGKYLFLFGLDVFCDIEEIENIILPTAKDRQYEIRDVLIKNNLYNKKKFVFCDKGNTRQMSVYNGLLKVNTNLVLISESVRPFITKKLVKRIIEDDYENVTPIDKSKASVIDVFNNIYNRDDIGTVQMPQKFNREKLLKAHECEIEKNDINNTDDTKVLLKYFSCINVIYGIEENIKVTTPLDLAIAKAIYKYKYEKMGAE
jgi:2-C-methyl-D-erythritol 4-phosphate cytidylyltransferase